jgi:hypothetical protein
MNETAKKALYAAVGAPVVTVRRVGARVEDVRDLINDRAGRLAEKVSTDVRKEFDVWASEGEKIVTQIGEQPVVEDITARVDLDQIQGQVHKLREQLEETVAAWRESFRPESRKETVTVEEKPAAENETERPEKAVAKTRAEKSTTKTAPKKASTKKTTAKVSAEPDRAESPEEKTEATE